MKTIAHLADLHFGTERPAVTEALVRDLASARPDLTVVSGDLTQRARRGEFEKARRFLDRLPGPRLVVPGNHDIPLADVARRFLCPLKRYRAYIGEPDFPLYTDGELAVLGINTARNWTWKKGSLGPEQIRRMRELLCGLDDALFKVIVTHHPFVPRTGQRPKDIVRHARLALKLIEACGADLILAGHLHRHYTGRAETYYPRSGRSLLVAQAGTAVSRRRRREPNAYNLVTVDGDILIVAPRLYRHGRFQESDAIGYRRAAGRWAEWPSAGELARRETA